jgi:hypothetical protein
MRAGCCPGRVCFAPGNARVRSLVCRPPLCRSREKGDEATVVTVPGGSSSSAVPGTLSNDGQQVNEQRSGRAA